MSCVPSEVVMCALIWDMEDYLLHFKCQKQVAKQCGYYDLICASGSKLVKLILISGPGLKVVFISSVFACLCFLIILIIIWVTTGTLRLAFDQ